MKCPECECQVSGDAELFLHQVIHGSPLPRFGFHAPLRELSGMQVRRLADVLESYAEVVRAKTLAGDSDATLLRGALRHATDLLTLRLNLADITDEEKQQRLVFLEILQGTMSEKLSEILGKHPMTMLEVVAFRDGWLAGLTAYATAIGHSGLKSENPTLKRLMEEELTHPRMQVDEVPEYPQ